MRVRIIRMIVVTAVTALMTLAVGAPLASAAKGECMHRMGSPQRLSDGGGVVQEWTIAELHKSSDVVPGYPVAGQLWEASATVRAVEGTVTPLIPNLAAAAGGERYPVLWQVASPYGIPGRTLAPGWTSRGKVYFDVTGAAPAMVLYQDGGQMPALMWCDQAAMTAMMATMTTQMKSTHAGCDCCADMPAPQSAGDCPCCADKP